MKEILIPLFKTAISLFIIPNTPLQFINIHLFIVSQT